MLLKVCGMVNAENISALIKLNPDFIGFIFYEKSPRFVGHFPEVEVPKHIKKVGVFVNEKLEKIIMWVNKFQLNAIQLHGNESAAYCNSLMQHFNKEKNTITIIKAFSVDNNFDFKTTLPYTNCCTYFLFDTKTKKYGGSGEKFNWKILKNYSYNTPYFLSGGIGVDDAETINKLKDNNLKGIDINSQFELAPGVKNIEMIKKFKNLLQ